MSTQTETAGTAEIWGKSPVGRSRCAELAFPFGVLGCEIWNGGSHRDYRLFSQGQGGCIFLSMISLRIYFCCCLFCFETGFLSVALAVLELLCRPG